MKLTLFDAEVRSLKTLLSTAIAPPDWEVEPLISKGQRVMLVGQWAAMKSWLLQDLGLALATGPAKWLGFFPISDRRRVLYFDKEMSAMTAQRRLQRLAWGRGIPIEDASIEEYPFHLVSHPRFEMSKDGGQRLLNALDAAKLEVDVIFLETFRRILKGSENDQEDVSAFWEGVDPIFKAGKTLYVSHHMRKPKRKNEQTRHMGSGSTDILAGADGVFALERGKVPSYVFLEHLKSRDAEEFNEGAGIGLHCDFQGHKHLGPIVWSLAQPDEQQLEIPQSPAEQGKAAMLTLLSRQPSATTAQLIAVGTPFGAQRTAERWRSELEDDKKIIRSAKGHYMLIPVADGVAGG